MASLTIISVGLFIVAILHWYVTVAVIKQDGLCETSCHLYEAKGQVQGQKVASLDVI